MVEGERDEWGVEKSERDGEERAVPLAPCRTAGEKEERQRSISRRARLIDGSERTRGRTLNHVMPT